MISVEEISVGYETGSTEKGDVLSGISFLLRDGETIALVGPNGAGKSTLIRALNRTLPIKRGKILLDGKELTKFSRREIAIRISVVAQENETRFPVSVLEFVLGGRYARGRVFGWETDEDMDAAREAISACDLEGLAEKAMNELSGGERQRVVLARALATEAGTLLLDEPTSNLDLAHQALMFRLVRRRCREAGGSAVIVTHDLNLAAEFADKVILLSRGRVFFSGAPSEVLTEKHIKEVFQVSTLVDRNPASGMTRVTTIF